MIRHAILAAALFSLAACGKKDQAPEPSAVPSEVSASPAPAASPSEAASAEPAATAAAVAAPSEDLAKLAVNTPLEVIKQTECREADPNKGSPWNLAPGVTVKFLAVEGAEIKVATLMSQCFLPADAVKVAK